MVSKRWQQQLTEVALASKRKLEGGREAFHCLGVCRTGEGTAATDSRHVTPLRDAVEMLKEIRNMAVKGTGKTTVLCEYWKGGNPKRGRVEAACFY